MNAPDPSLIPFGTPEAWKQAFGFARRALVRSRLSILVLTVVFAAAGVVAAAVAPRSFSTDARLLVRKAEVMPALAHPRRSVPAGTESLTQSAGDLVRDRKALQSIVEQYDLVNRWRRDRPVALKLKDSLMERVRGPVPQEELIETLVDVLARRITVTVDGEVITVWARWTDAQTAVDIVQGATEAFLQARRRVDIDAIAETHQLLERTADAVRVDVERQVSASALTQQLRPVRPARVSRPVELPRLAADPLVTMRNQAVAARTAGATAAATHQAAVRALEAQLEERLAAETERHPDVVALRRKIEQARELPGVVLEAQAEAARLSAAYVAAGGRASDLTGEPAAAPAPVVDRAAPIVNVSSATDEDDATVYARSLLESSISTYQDLLDRLSNTRIELETARAAFDYRYTLVSGARTPRGPDSPNVLFIVVGALMAGFMTGALRAVVVEVRQ